MLVTRSGRPGRPRPQAASSARALVRRSAVGRTATGARSALQRPRTACSTSDACSTAPAARARCRTASTRGASPTAWRSVPRRDGRRAAAARSSSGSADVLPRHRRRRGPAAVLVQGRRARLRARARRARRSRFPDYDGNGMYLSTGNLAENPHVGLLFIDFAGRPPRRLRAQRRGARRRGRPAARATYPGAQLASACARRRCSPTARATCTAWSSPSPRAYARPPTAPRRSRTGSGRTGRCDVLPAVDPARGDYIGSAAAMDFSKLRAGRSRRRSAGSCSPSPSSSRPTRPTTDNPNATRRRRDRGDASIWQAHDHHPDPAAAGGDRADRPLYIIVARAPALLAARRDDGRHRPGGRRRCCFYVGRHRPPGRAVGPGQPRPSAGSSRCSPRAGHRRRRCHPRRRSSSASASRPGVL